jgi:hypothetical protein
VRLLTRNADTFKTVVSPRGNPAETSWKVLKYLERADTKEQLALVRCWPLTGRTHQVGKWEHSGHIRGTFTHSGNIERTFKEHTGHIQGITF